MWGPLQNRQCSIQFMSDLHLERMQYDFTITPAAPILILAGDIGRICDSDAYAAWLRKQCAQFDRVLLVAGNHEFYGSSRDEGLAALQALEQDPAMQGKLTFMHRTRIDLPERDVTVLGCTLHSHISPETKLTNDFRRIQDWSVAKHNAEHERDLAWLKQCLEALVAESTQRRVLVVTHYAPSFEQTCHPENTHNAVSACFSSDLLTAFPGWQGSRLVGHWVFGHTHWNARFTCGGAVVVSNQRCNDEKNVTWLQRMTLYRKFEPVAVLKV